MKVSSKTPKQKKPENKVAFLNSNWEIWVTRNMSYWHQHLSILGVHRHLWDFGVPLFEEQLAIVLNGTETTIFQREDVATKNSEIILHAAVEKPGILAIEKKYLRFSKKLLVSFKNCDRMFTPKNWKIFTNEYRRFCASLQVTALIGRVGADHLKKLLMAEKFDENETANTISIITYPTRHTPLFNSRLDLLLIGVALQKKKLSKVKLEAKLNQWLRKYQHIPVNFCEEPWMLADVYDQLESVLKKDCRIEVARLKREHAQKIQEVTRVLTKINNRAITKVAKVLAEATYLNEYRKNIFSQVSLGYRSIFQRIAESVGWSNWRNCYYLNADEMHAILAGKKMDISEIKKRRQIIGFYIGQGEIKFLDEVVLERFKKHLDEVHGKGHNFSDQREFRGFSANKGKISGVVKIVFSSKDFAKVNIGDILVAPHTSVDFIPVMERAAAFVTNEGGITSHASIVSREMGKPCIIGTKIATQVLKDGDLVEVDAERGTVTIIKRA